MSSKLKSKESKSGRKTAQSPLKEAAKEEETHFYEEPIDVEQSPDESRRARHFSIPDYTKESAMLRRASQNFDKKHGDTSENANKSVEKIRSTSPTSRKHEKHRSRPKTNPELGTPRVETEGKSLTKMDSFRALGEDTKKKLKMNYYVRDDQGRNIIRDTNQSPTGKHNKLVMPAEEEKAPTFAVRGVQTWGKYRRPSLSEIDTSRMSRMMQDIMLRSRSSRNILQSDKPVPPPPQGKMVNVDRIMNQKKKATRVKANNPAKSRSANTATSVDSHRIVGPKSAPLKPNPPMPRTSSAQSFRGNQAIQKPEIKITDYDESNRGSLYATQNNNIVARNRGDTANIPMNQSKDMENKTVKTNSRKRPQSPRRSRSPEQNRTFDSSHSETTIPKQNQRKRAASAVESKTNRSLEKDTPARGGSPVAKQNSRKRAESAEPNRTFDKESTVAAPALKTKKSKKLQVDTNPIVVERSQKVKIKSSRSVETPRQHQQSFPSNIPPVQATVPAVKKKPDRTTQTITPAASINIPADDAMTGNHYVPKYTKSFIARARANGCNMEDTSSWNSKSKNGVGHSHRGSLNVAIPRESQRLLLVSMNDSPRHCRFDTFGQSNYSNSDGISPWQSESDSERGLLLVA